MVSSYRRAVAVRFEEATRGNHEREKPFMSLASHLEELQRKHGDVERELDEAMTHPSVDDLDLATLKRKKLAIKDEIAKLQGTRH